MKLNKSIGIFIITLLFASSCKQGPKIISTPVDEGSIEQSSGIFSEDNNVESSSMSNSSIASGVHTVTVEEVLPTSKYVYLNVKEGDESFWIATLKQEVQVGETYFFRDGLLKTNFESKEYNRVFETVYLVSNLVLANHSNSSALSQNSTKPAQNSASSSSKMIDQEGSLSIAEIVENPTEYVGKTVQISGACVKVNPNIMGRNWIHLKDGSKDDYDLVITSDIAVPEGQIVTMTGVVTLDKDFGAGYKYEIIIEEGKLVQMDQ